MFLFGWGRKNLTKQIAQNKAIILNYGYFHIFFVFTFTFGYKYIEATLSDKGWHHKPMSKEEADAVLKGQELKPHWWWRYSLVGVFVLAPVCVFIGLMISAMK
jgi:hypothetical protein